MTELALVKKIEGKMVTVSIELQEGCAACSNGACKANRSALQAYNRNDVKIAEGDEVEIEIPGAEQAKSAFWVLGLPLVALFAGYGLGRILFPTGGESPAVGVSGALFLILMAAGIMIQKKKKYETMPVIVRKFGEYGV